MIRGQAHDGAGGRARMTGMLATAILGLGVAVAPVEAQSARLWATVVTTEGERHTGFLRWDRNEAVTGDLLDGSRAPDSASVAAWQAFTAAEKEEGALERSIEYAGYRITWDDDAGDLPALRESGIRFGWIRTLRPDGDDAAVLELVGGGEIRLEGGSTDLGDDVREILLDIPGGPDLALEWDEIRELSIGPPPPGVEPSATRLHGTVEDRRGERWTGWIAWDADAALSDDPLPGEVDGARREIPFARVRSIARDGFAGAVVTLDDGTRRSTSGTNAVGGGNRGISISDGGLGRVELPWSEFRQVDFHPPAAAPPSGVFDEAPHRLHGTVRTEGGRTFTGDLRWDADESESWELLNGSDGGVEFAVEFSRIVRIEKRSSRSARVHLRDGRILVLDGSNDVDERNRGIFVETENGLEVVSWRNFDTLELHPRRTP